MPRSAWIVIFGLVGFLWIASRLPSLISRPSEPPSLFTWTLPDLVALDPAEASQPSLDVVAVYLRRTPQGIDIRLDFLELSPLPAFDLYLALDFAPGGEKRLPIQATAEIPWEALLIAPAQGEARLIGADGRPLPNSTVFLWREAALDRILIRLQGPLFHAQQPRVQAFLCPGGQLLPADRSPVAAKDMANLRPAPVVMLFTRTLPAYTPASALRRWNGAHTGPYGGNHGLALLLNAARAASVPLVLADLATPEALAALESLSSLNLVRQMAEEGLLILPEDDTILPAWVTAKHNLAGEHLVRLQRTRSAFDLPSSPFAIAPFDWNPLWLPRSPRLLFVPYSYPSESLPNVQPPYRRLAQRGSMRILAFPQAPSFAQIDLDGPTLDLKRALIETALAANHPDGASVVLVLGGDLPSSPWGAAGLAAQAFHYLRSRPWVYFLNANQLATFPAVQSSPSPIETPSEISPWAALLEHPQRAELLHSLHTAPHNSLREAALHAYRALYAPLPYPASQLAALRTNYLGIVWSLIAASHWAEDPTPTSTCQTDPDRDGEAECLLISAHFYAQFEIKPAALTFFFSRHSLNGQMVVHQWIAPSAQLISGLSDPATWNLAQGYNADPGVLPGAFDGGDPRCDSHLAGETLDFTCEGGRILKRFALHENGLLVTLRSSQPATTPWRIPFILDPWERFTPGWPLRYRQKSSPEGWLLWLDPQNALPTHALRMSTSAPFSVHSAFDSLPWLKRPENPNQDYPPGHYLPFPLFLAVIPWQPQIDLKLDIIELADLTPSP